MLSKKYLPVVVLVLFSGCTRQSFEISVLPSRQDRGIVQVMNGDEEISSGELNGATLKLKGKIKTAGFVKINVTYNGRSKEEYPVFLEQGSYTVQLKKNGAYPEITSSSPEQGELTLFHHLLAQSDSLARAAYAAAKLDEKEQFETASAEQYNKIVYRISDASRSRQMADQSTRLSFIKKYPASLVSAYLLNGMKIEISEDPESYLAIYQSLGKTAKESVYGDSVKNLLDKYRPSAVGAVLPDLTGEVYNAPGLDKSRLKGKITLLSFWASYIVGAEESDFRSMKSLYDRYHAKGFEIIGISADNHREKWIKSIKDNELNWVQYCDFKGSASDNFHRFATNQLPYYILVGPDLKIIERNSSPRDVLHCLETHLDK